MDDFKFKLTDEIWMKIHDVDSFDIKELRIKDCTDDKIRNSIYGEIKKIPYFKISPNSEQSFSIYPNDKYSEQINLYSSFKDYRKWSRPSPSRHRWIVIIGILSVVIPSVIPLFIRSCESKHDEQVFQSDSVETYIYEIDSLLNLADSISFQLYKRDSLIEVILSDTTIPYN